MQEIFEFRINNKYAHLLLKPGEGKNNGSNTIILISKNDPKYERIKSLSKEVTEKYNDFFFLYSSVNRKYSDKELNAAVLLRIKIKPAFEPAGEECGTLYDESIACEICGANRKQIGLLKLKKSSVPKKDITRTIAGEVIVSEKFMNTFNQRNLRGASFEQIAFDDKVISNYYQLIAASPELELTQNTIAGVNFFDLSEKSESIEFTVSGSYHVKLEKEIYKCPKGHTIGLNLLSEAYVSNLTAIGDFDFFITKQKLGVKRGLLRPEPLYLCSSSFRKMIEEEKLSGFDFEIAYVENIN